MYITDDIFYVGVNDHDIDLFEGQYVVKNGMSYNSYVVKDEKITVFDTVDTHFSKEWLANLKELLSGKTPDYLIVQHMEPDHSANIAVFMSTYPETKIVASSKAFAMMKEYFGTDFADRQVVVADGSTLCTGRHNFRFVTAPLVHWPEVIVTFDETDGVLFSADAFGKFGALDVDEEWTNEARRYYIGIVGKFGVQVQNLFKKVAELDIKKICPLHGPVLCDNLAYYIGLYDKWSKYQAESDGVVIAYTSVYGHTKSAVEILSDKLKADGQTVVVYDLARCDQSAAVADAFRYSKLVLATTTYNGSIFPFMRDFINTLVEHNYQNRTVAFIENGSWSPVATKVMSGMLEGGKNLCKAENGVKIFSALDEENIKQIHALATEIK